MAKKKTNENTKAKSNRSKDGPSEKVRAGVAALAGVGLDGPSKKGKSASKTAKKTDRKADNRKIEKKPEHKTAGKKERRPAEKKTGTGKGARTRTGAGGSRTAPAASVAIRRRTAPADPSTPLRVIPLGGVGEIGKNLTVIEYGEDILVVDCGVAFPDDDLFGVDLVIPDITYLEKNADRVRAILLTHGHEDHIGSLPYVLRTVCPPIYGTRLTLGIVAKKLEEHELPHRVEMHTVECGDSLRFGCFDVEFIRVNHSIADACCLAIHSPVGTVVHTGDFKFDVSPIDGQMMDIVRLGELGREGVELLLCESTNAERQGHTPSERKVGNSFEEIFNTYPDKRIIVATFSSNIHRVQQIINSSVRHGRHVAVLGRSMLNVVGAAIELGYIAIPEGTLIDITDIKKYPANKVALITTGSQGEPMSALYRMAFGEHDRVRLGTGDVVVLSSSAIPGNEKLIGKIINALTKSGIRVVSDSVADVHVSGHACAEELKLMDALTRPKYFMPIHGEYRHLAANREIAEFMGVPHDNIFMPEIGSVLEIRPGGASWGESVTAGRVLVDGSGVGDVGSVVLRDRRHLAQDGLMVVVATVDLSERAVISGPDIVSRGFVYVRDSEEIIEELRSVAASALENALDRGITDWVQLKGRVKDQLSKYIYSKMKRSPMILPVIMSI